jgi:PKD repeat protein
LCLLIIAALTVSAFSLTANTKAQNSSTATLSILPSTVSLTQPGETFTLDINISGVSNLFLWDLNITWDPTALSLVGTPQEGAFLAQGGTTIFAAVPPLANVTSWVEMTDALISSNGVSGSGELASIEFEMTSQNSTTSIQISNVTLEQPLPSGAVTGTPHPTISLSSTSLTTTINFSQGAPAANAGSNKIVKEGQLVQFDGSKTKYSGTNPTYSWSFTYNGVIQNLTGVNPTFTFNIPGVYVITLIVTDSIGTSNPATVTITVQGPQPTAKIVIEGFNAGQSAKVGQSLIFNGTGSSASVNGTLRYLWNMGTAFTSANQTVTYAYTVAGTFNVTLTVTDVTGMNDTAVYPLTVGAGSSTPTPPPTTEPTSSSGPTPTGSSSTATSTPTSMTYDSGGSLPADVLAIVIITTFLALAGSTLWLRKRV